MLKTAHLGPDGSLAVNPHGGHLSQAHLDGMLHVTEAVRQLRGKAGSRQIKEANSALVSGFGGIFATSGAAILGSARLPA